MSEQQIEKGQTWRRKKDGKLIRIVRDQPHDDDYHWSAIAPNGALESRKHACFGPYIRKNYVLVGRVSE